MKVSELIALLQQSLEQDGDLEAVVCGLDGYGYSSLTEVKSAMPVVVSDHKIVCEYENAAYASTWIGVTYIG